MPKAYTSLFSLNVPCCWYSVEERRIIIWMSLVFASAATSEAPEGHSNSVNDRRCLQIAAVRLTYN
jgi:hypothetical protein